LDAAVTAWLPRRYTPVRPAESGKRGATT
jgi:hypothetical protein